MLGISSRMSTFVRNLTITPAALTVVEGIYIESLLAIIGVQLPNTTELRWTLLLGMPVVLILAYMRLNRLPAKTPLNAAIQSVGLLALSFSPYWWVAYHAQ